MSGSVGDGMASINGSGSFSHPGHLWFTDTLAEPTHVGDKATAVHPCPDTGPVHLCQADIFSSDILAPCERPPPLRQCLAHASTEIFPACGEFLVFVRAQAGRDVVVHSDRVGDGKAGLPCFGFPLPS